MYILSLFLDATTIPAVDRETIGIGMFPTATPVQLRCRNKCREDREDRDPHGMKKSVLAPRSGPA